MTLTAAFQKLSLRSPAMKPQIPQPKQRTPLFGPMQSRRFEVRPLLKMSDVPLDPDEQKIHPSRLKFKPFVLPMGIITHLCDSFYEALLGLILKLRQLYKEYKHLDSEVQQQINFGFATFLGTLVFYLLFECIHYFIASLLRRTAQIEAPSYTFGIAYSISYLVSVGYQHALNRWIVFTPSDTFCESLLQTYVVYGVSLVVTSIIGSILMSVTGVSPEAVLTITLPLSGLSNYWMLRFKWNKITSQKYKRQKI